MSLEDTLRQLAQEKETGTPAPAQEKPEETAEENTAEETPPGSLTERLQGIGDKHAVNPPEPEEKADRPAPSKTPEPTTKEPENPNECPHCLRIFKQLSRHSCKMKPAEEPKEEPAEPKEEPAAEEKMWYPEDCDCDVITPESIDDAEGTTTKERTAEDALADQWERREKEREGSRKEKDWNGYDLYIDAVIVSSQDEFESMNLCDIVTPIAAVINKENNVGHWKLLDYGKGPGHLAERLERWILHNKPTGNIWMFSRTLEGGACRDVLMRYARNIIQGVV